MLLDVAKKHPDWIVVPGPMQFERSRHGDRNADFIVIDTGNKQSIGIQVKSSVRDETIAKYDPAWIVLVDGDTDFNNVQAMRTKALSSDQKVVSWAGILSAHHLSKLSTKNRPLSSPDRMLLMRQRLVAKAALSDVKVKDYPEIIKRIDERISPKLAD